jgi:hypothetical protein
MKTKVAVRQSTGKLYVGHYSQDGKVQRAFREIIGKPAGQCIKAGIRPGMTKEERRRVFKGCAIRGAGILHLGSLGSSRRSRRRIDTE